MKNMSKAVIIALAAVIVFSLAGCSNPTSNPTDPTSKSVDSIEVTTQPTKVQYNLNETFDRAGMVVTATYDDGTTEAVTGYTIEGFSSATAGNKDITVKYQGKETTFTVTVIDPSKQTAATPTASPAAGAVASGTTVTLSTTTTDAEIWYTTNGTTPAKNGSGSTKYTTPIAITAAVTIKAIAVKDDMNDSAELAAAYTIVAANTVATPAASPAAGAVAAGATVTLSTTTTGAEIWYTTDGTTPAKDGTGSAKYATPIAITAAVTIKAIAVKDGMNDSAELAAAYTIQAGGQISQTPVAADYDIGGTTVTYDGTAKTVTVTAKQGKSPGGVTVLYNGNATAPSAAGTYPVTFNVAAATGWNAASGLAAGTLTINPKAVTITGVSAANKVYNGTTAATASGTATIDGNVDGGNLTVTAGTAAFADKNVGNAKTVTFSGYALGGTAAGNYTLSAQPANATANITALPLTIGTPTGSPTKVYDGDTTYTGNGITAGSLTNVVSGDTVSVSITSTTYNDANVASANQITIVYAIDGADKDNYVKPANGTISAIITKADGAAITVAPTAATIGVTSVTLTAVTAPTNGQTVEYASSTTNTAPSTGWQSGTTFTGLTAATTYYFFAHSAGNSNYETGAASSGTAITTKQQAGVTIINYWVDDTGEISIGEDGEPIAGNTVTVEYGESITFEAGESFNSQQWTLNGASAGTAATFTFNTTGRAPGRDYVIGLRVQQNGKFYFTQITVKVEE